MRVRFPPHVPMPKLVRGSRFLEWADWEIYHGNCIELRRYISGLFYTLKDMERYHNVKADHLEKEFAELLERINDKRRTR